MGANEFDDPRIAGVYDVFDSDRGDLDLYLAIVAELGASSVLDLGCGTGTLAIMLAGSGCDVAGVDPAGAMLDVARGKPGADRVRWIHGDALAVPAELSVDVVTLTGNAAQAIVDDADWRRTLEAVHPCTRATAASFRNGASSYSQSATIPAHFLLSSAPRPLGY